MQFVPNVLLLTEVTLAYDGVAATSPNPMDFHKDASDTVFKSLI